MNTCASHIFLVSSLIIYLIKTEATTGIGPMGRERFWAVLEHLKDLGHTIIFTSFHTEECLKLSTKLVVLADGKPILSYFSCYLNFDGNLILFKICRQCSMFGKAG